MIAVPTQNQQLPSVLSVLSHSYIKHANLNKLQNPRVLTNVMHVSLDMFSDASEPHDHYTTGQDFMLWFY